MTVTKWSILKSFFLELKIYKYIKNIYIINEHFKGSKTINLCTIQNSLYSYPLSPQGLHHPFACTEQIKTDIIIVIRIMIVTSPFP